VEHNEKMARLYREVVLKEKAPVAENGFLPLTALGGTKGISPAVAAERQVEEPVAGD
jgi:hypothetical protein